MIKTTLVSSIIHTEVCWEPRFPCVKTSQSQKIPRQIVCTKLSQLRNILASKLLSAKSFTAKSPYAEVSSQRNVITVNCSNCEKSLRQSVPRQNFLRRKQPRQIFRLQKGPPEKKSLRRYIFTVKCTYG